MGAQVIHFLFVTVSFKNLEQNNFPKAISSCHMLFTCTTFFGSAALKLDYIDYVLKKNVFNSL